MHAITLGPSWGAALNPKFEKYGGWLRNSPNPCGWLHEPRGTDARARCWIVQVQQAEDTASMGGDSDEGSGWETASDEEDEEGGQEGAAASGAGPMAEDAAEEGALPLPARGPPTLLSGCPYFCVYSERKQASKSSRALSTKGPMRLKRENVTA